MVRRSANGDRNALAKLYDRHAPILSALVRQILGPRGDAEDLVHDVFLEAWRHAGEYDPKRASVRTWFVMRARSRAIDLLRSARVSRAADGGLERAGEDADAGRALLEATELAPDRARIHEALATLPDEQRTVLLLGYFKGMSCSEIADHVGIPVGTVKSRTIAALSKLRSCYAPTRGSA